MRQAIAGLFLLFAACGKVGDPLPPFIRIPEAVKDLVVAQNAYNLVLTWTNPPHNIDGSSATNLAHVQIRSNDATIATLSAGEPGKPQSYAIPVRPAAANGARSFSVIMDTSEGKLSRVSNVVSITPVEVPGAVTPVRVVPDQRRIVVQWAKPGEHPELADAYLVVRTSLPVESATVSDTRYEDTRYEAGKMVTYQVTPLRNLAGTMVPGTGSEPVTVTVEDKTPPQVPAGLDVTPSGNGAFVTWDANEETDLAGYRLFRSEHADADFKPVSDRPIVPNSFFDAAYKPGLYYAVLAMDESGNESMKSPAFRAP